MSPNVNYGLEVIIMSQCRFISVPLWGRTTIVGEAVHGSGLRVCGNSVLPAKFCCEPKAALESKVYYFLEG